MLTTIFLILGFAVYLAYVIVNKANGGRTTDDVIGWIVFGAIIVGMWVKKAHALANPALICLVSINLAINSINTLSYYRWIGNPDKTRLNVWLAAGIIDCSTGYRVDGIWDLSICSIWLGMVFGLLYCEGEGEKQLA